MEPSPEKLEPNEELEKRQQEIEKILARNLEFVSEMLRIINDHVQSGDEPGIDWKEIQGVWLREQKLISDIMNMGKESGVLIDPQYYLIPAGLSKRLGTERLGAIKETLGKFVPLSKISKHLTEINVQAEEAYLSMGCDGFYHDGVAEVPKHITFDTANMPRFFATLLHEAVGHPIEDSINATDEVTRNEMLRSYEVIKTADSFFQGSVGRIYPLEELRGQFGQFVAEFTKQYCLDSDELRSFMQELPPEIRNAYNTFYNFLKEEIFNGREFNKKDIESLMQIAEQQMLLGKQ
ncbi:MAG: hypothetical protein WC242_04430 [Candidatus Paceibacterota bacterium]|jgi:hypothetical protein